MTWTGSIPRALLRGFRRTANRAQPPSPGTRPPGVSHRQGLWAGVTGSRRRTRTRKELKPHDQEARPRRDLRTRGLCCRVRGPTSRWWIAARFTVLSLSGIALEISSERKASTRSRLKWTKASDRRHLLDPVTRVRANSASFRQCKITSLRTLKHFRTTHPASSPQGFGGSSCTHQPLISSNWSPSPRDDGNMTALEGCCAKAPLDSLDPLGRFLGLHTASMVEHMFDRAKAIGIIEADQCACSGCSGRLTAADLSPNGWRHCQACRCAWKVERLASQGYACHIGNPALGPPHSRSELVRVSRPGSPA